MAAAVPVALLELAANAAAELNLVNCTTALQRLAKVDDTASLERDDVAPLVARTAACFGSERPQTRQVAGALWALAKLRASCAVSDLASAVLLGSLVLQPGWYKPQEASMSIWALGKLSGDLPAALFDDDGAGTRFVRPIVISALARANSFGAQGLANLISGLASIGSCGVEDVANKLARCLLGRLDAFGAQELSNALSGLAKLGARLDACGALASEASVALRAMVDPRAARRCTPQNLANAAWSATKLVELSRRGGGGGGSLGFWGLFAGTVTARVAELNALELSTCAWAAAHGLAHATNDVGAALPALCAALAAKAGTLALAGEMSPQQLATVALSLCKMGCVDRESLKAVEDAARKRIKEFTPQDLDNLASGFARHELQWKSKKLVVSLALQGAAAVARKEVGDDAFFKNMDRVAPPRNVANLLTAIAKLASTAKCCGCQGARTFANASAAALTDEGRLDAFNLKDLANAAWGLAILGREANEKIAACMRSIGRAAVPLLGGGSSSTDTAGAGASGASDGVFLAQECSRLLYAMGTAGVSCPELEAAAGEERELSFSFHAPVGTVALRQVFGGTQGEYLKREETGAIAGNGGALFEDAYVLAEWLGRLSSPAACVRAAASAETTAFANHVALQHASWRGRSMVELGAGLGLCSIVAQRLGMQVAATDGDESVLAQLRANAARNPSADSGSGSALTAHLLKWGNGNCPDPLRELGLDSSGPADLLVATGCVYGRDVGVWRALVETMVALSGPGTVVLMAHGPGAAPGIHQLRGTFYEMAAPYFEIARAAQETLKADHSSCQIHMLVRKGGDASGHAGTALAPASSMLSKRKRGAVVADEEENASKLKKEKKRRKKEKKAKTADAAALAAAELAAVEVAAQAKKEKKAKKKAKKKQAAEEAATAAAAAVVAAAKLSSAMKKKKKKKKKKQKKKSM